VIEFHYVDVWMSLLAYSTLLTPEEMVEALNENGFECQASNIEWKDEKVWSSFRLSGPAVPDQEQVALEVNLFPATYDVAIKGIGYFKERVERQSVCEERSNVLQMLEEVRYIAQTVKVAGDFEASAELEFGVHCCFGFPVEPDEGVSTWAISNEDTLGFATESELLLKFEDSAYRNLISKD